MFRCCWMKIWKRWENYRIKCDDGKKIELKTYFSLATLFSNIIIQNSKDIFHKERDPIVRCWRSNDIRMSNTWIYIPTFVLHAQQHIAVGTRREKSLTDEMLPSFHFITTTDTFPRLIIIRLIWDFRSTRSTTIKTFSKVSESVFHFHTIFEASKKFLLILSGSHSFFLFQLLCCDLNTWNKNKKCTKSSLDAERLKRWTRRREDCELVNELELLCCDF